MSTKNTLKTLALIPVLLAFLYSGGTLLAQTTPRPLVATCTPKRTQIFVSHNLTWNSNVTGGVGNYRYEWSGTDNLIASTSSVTITYTTLGIKTASLFITSGTQSLTINCTSAVDVIAPVITGFCGVNASLHPEDYIVTWKSNARTFGFTDATDATFSWLDPNGVTESGQSIERLYNTASTTSEKVATVSIQAGGQSLSLVCRANVSNSTALPINKFFNGSCSPSVNGMEVFWNANSSGTLGTTTYSWSGDDGLATTSRNTRIKYLTEGTKNAQVRINSGDRSIILDCQARVASTTAVSGSHCFIATAAFGTNLEPQVMILRHFRDKALLTNTLGQAFVEEYYKISPPIADFIRTSNSLKAVVRVGLSPIIFTLKHLGYSS